MIVTFAFVVHLFLLCLFKSYATRASSSFVDLQLLAALRPPPTPRPISSGLLLVAARWKNTINYDPSYVLCLPRLLALSFASLFECSGKIEHQKKKKKQQPRGEFAARLSKLKQIE